MAPYHLDEIILVQNIDVEGKKYDKVSRIDARNEGGEIYMQLDVHSEIYPMRAKEKYRMLLSETLSLDGSASYPEGKQKSLADKFEYVMHGLLYKISEEKSKAETKVTAFISFGGLQLMVKAPYSKMIRFRVDQRLFLLLRKMNDV
ncbi:hypothetical protein M9H77_33634 [Catharanthus roseus]|uniref:Uncharacterized protein n=1 Tax=Catharanthus roseus TaxID=4058 RepID=A0ACB9ZJ12_CATRO|nr:hypothetical protein M9H77_33634 [Catharanthus roseus]